MRLDFAIVNDSACVCVCVLITKLCNTQVFLIFGVILMAVDKSRFAVLFAL